MRIAALAYDGCFGAELFGFVDLLQLATRVASKFERDNDPPFAVTIVGAGRTATLAGGLRLMTPTEKGKFDLLVVPGFDFAKIEDLDRTLRNYRPVIEMIRDYFDHGVAIASVCVGAFLLGEAGVLDGRKATTGWMFTGELARRYPLVRVQPTAMIVEDHGVTTCGAFTAAFDLASSLIRRCVTARTCRFVLRMALSDGKSRTQAEYIDHSIVQSSRGKFSDEVNRWLARRIGKTYSLRELASAMHVSSRTLLRRYKSETRETPLTYLQRLRIEHAKRLLESRRESVATISDRVGYTDTSTFRRLFSRLTGVSPAQYRRRFGHS